MANLTHEDWLAAAGKRTPETRPLSGITFPPASPRDGSVPADCGADDADRAAREDSRRRDLS
ncbi:hypothetical protein AB0F91_09295 [Amycolatopsis sp. NPDC023774]|uniref:hypothetical protein n=1 Tax=Amycolatopsis sp. NPDC023774 TaxID=3155015 RepID=UPI0033F94B16